MTAITNFMCYLLFEMEPSDGPAHTLLLFPGALAYLANQQESKAVPSRLRHSDSLMTFVFRDVAGGN
jgi:hypothetical protein